MAEVQPRLAQTLIPGWLRAWWPALLWACVIFTLSTDSFSSAHTEAVLTPIAHWFLPSLSQDQLDAINHYIRKTAHFGEYFVFCMLLYHGIRGSRKGWRWAWGLTALGIAAGYSALDEIHQAFVASRTASAWDSLLDSAGAFAAFAFLLIWFQVRKKPSELSSAPTSAEEANAS